MSARSRMDAFQFPSRIQRRPPSLQSDVDHPTDPRPSFQTDGESINDSMYDTDGESLAMTPSVSNHAYPHLSPHPHPIGPHPVLKARSQPGESRFSTAGSGTRSDDTMYEEYASPKLKVKRSLSHDSPASSSYRRHSDGPLYQRHALVARFVETQRMPRVSRLRAEPSELHPYVSSLISVPSPDLIAHRQLLHFTSPIDLLDGPRHQHGGRDLNV